MTRPFAGLSLSEPKFFMLRATQHVANSCYDGYLSKPAIAREDISTGTINLAINCRAEQDWA